MEQITAYKTLDGTVFEDEETARKYESKQMMTEELYKFVSRNIDVLGGEISEIVSVLIEKRFELLKIYDSHDI